MITKKLSDEEVWLRALEMAISKQVLRAGWQVLANSQITEAVDNADTILDHFTKRFRGEEDDE